MTFVMLRPEPRQDDAPETPLAPRLTSLQGKVVGTLWNNRANGNHYLDRLGAQLVRRYGVREIVPVKKTYNNSKAPDEVLEDLRERCDAVVVGVGD